MRAVAQRVRRARVEVAGERVAEMGHGLLALVGVAHGDGDDDAGVMNRALGDVAGTLGVVSQFTLLGDCRKGRRPSYADAAVPEEAEARLAVLVAHARALGVTVVTGRFRAEMAVELVNEGPVTLLLDTRRLF